MNTWNNKIKRLLKSELIKRGISNTELSALLNARGIKETKSSIDSKISRGTFSAAFLLQCLTVIGCSKIDIEIPNKPILNIAAEPTVAYKHIQHEKK